MNEKNIFVSLMGISFVFLKNISGQSFYRLLHFRKTSLVITKDMASESKLDEKAWKVKTY